MIDPESEELIVKVRLYLSDPENVRKVQKEALEKAVQFLGTCPDHVFESLLTSKMITGASKHGPPSKDLIKIEFEIAQEILDLIGWGFVEKNAKGEL